MAENTERPPIMLVGKLPDKNRHMTAASPQETFDQEHVAGAAHAGRADCGPSPRVSPIMPRQRKLTSIRVWTGIFRCTAASRLGARSRPQGAASNRWAKSKGTKGVDAAGEMSHVTIVERL